MTGSDADLGTGLYQTNGHEFDVITEYDGDELLECQECMVREVLDEDDDPEDYLELVTPECHIEWVREPDGGFHGIALRNASGFSGRELISVDSDGEVTDTIRVYDEDTRSLNYLVDLQKWEEMER